MDLCSAKGVCATATGSSRRATAPRRPMDERGAARPQPWLKIVFGPIPLRRHSFDVAHAPTNPSTYIGRYLFATAITLFGISGCDDAEADPESETAFRCAGAIAAGVVGLDEVYLSGAPRVAGEYDSVFSNSHIHLDGYVTVGGDLVSGGTIFAEPQHAIGGTKLANAGTIKVDDPTPWVAAAALENDNDLIPCIPYNGGQSCRNPVQNGTLTLMNVDVLTLPSGNYYFKDVFVDGSARLRINGSATFYVENDASFNGATEATSLTVISAASDGVIEFNGYTQVQMTVFAPYSTVLFTGGQGFRGGVVGGVVRMSGSAGITATVDALAPYLNCDPDLPPLPDLPS